MLDLLARANIDVLHQFARSKVLLAFDFDGTLAPIVRDPDAACLRPRTRVLLERLCLRYPSVVISGRALADVRARLVGLAFDDVVGNHGLEPDRRGASFARTVGRWVPVLEKRLRGIGGVVIEDKGFSLAVHYRKSHQKLAARRAIASAARELQPLRVVGGKHVVNLLPPGAPHKGVALCEARERLGCDTAIYVGDDVTDEDVFALDEPGRLLGVRVGVRKGSRAPFFLQRQAAIDDFLEVLAAARTKEHRHDVERRPARAVAAAG